jgi:hypothetical protein
MSGKKIISIDVGFGYTKGCSNFSKEEVVFPTAYKAKTTSYQSALGGYTKDYDITINDKKYFVGDLALIQNAKRHFQDQDKIDQEKIDIMIGTVLHQIGFGLKEEQKEIEIRLGVPLYLFQYPKMLIEMENKIKESEFKIVGDRIESNFKIKKATIHPQSIGAYADLISKKEITNTEKVVIIDVGYRTIDYVVIESGNIIEEMTGTFPESGTNYIYEDISNFIESKTSKKLSVEKIETYIEENKKYKGVSLRDIEKKVVTKHLNQIVSELNRKWGDNKNDIEKLILVGGGAKLMQDEFSKHFENVLKVKETQMRNAQGYLYL